MKLIYYKPSMTLTLIVLIEMFFPFNTISCQKKENIIQPSTKMELFASQANENKNIGYDIAIIFGNKIAYRNYHNECVKLLMEGYLSYGEQRMWLLNAYIMAEQYKDTLAAFDFVQIIEYLNINVDSTLSIKIIEYLKMSSQYIPSLIAFFSALKLSEIYKNGLYEVGKDSILAEYYRKLSESISQAQRNQKRL